jgi:putative nucleotidyltransferase with HDIG domain
MSTVENILEATTQLPPFPTVLQRVLQLMDDPKSSAQDVVNAIQYDQSITANVLMVCNSAYFGLRRPVFSIREALIRIGFDQLLEIILSQGSSSLFYRACQGYDLEAGELWRHSVACALLSQIISDRLNQERTAIQFTAALLHDMGKILLSEFVKEHFAEIKKWVQEKEVSFIEAEQAVLGIDHAELGAKLSEKWNFPKAIISVLRYHHTPLLSPTDHHLVSLIYLCDIVAMMTGYGGGADGLSYHGNQDIVKQFDLKEKDIEMIILELQERLKEVELLLNMPKGEM